MGLNNYHTIADSLDSNELLLYNAYVSKYLADDNTLVDNLADTNTLSDNLTIDSNISDNSSLSKVSFLPTTNWQKASKIIERNATAIKNAGLYYGVNPAIIAACIYTEQTTNVNIVDHLTDLPAYFADTSIGIGQVKVSTAKMLEDNGYIDETKYAGTERVWTGTWSYYTDVWYAPAYGRVQGSRENAIAHRLTVESENINYVAAYLKYFQDRWKDVYPKIDGDTAVLATLYNQDETRPPHSKPEPRPFGIQAKKEYDDMRQLLGLY